MRAPGTSAGGDLPYDPGVTELRVHHLNCGTMCPRGRRAINGHGGLLALGGLVCHVLLIEAPQGLILVDTGFGTRDVRKPGRYGSPIPNADGPASG